MRLASAVVAGSIAALAAAQPARAQETFDVSAFEKKAFEWTGFLELRPERQSLRRDSTGYQLLSPGQARGTVDRRGAAAELSGVARHDSLSFRFTGHASSLADPRDSDDDARMYEAYAAWQIDARGSAEAGKRTLRWGKGYAFSPVAFLERPKDPTDPELSREGFMMASGTWVRSLDGPLQTVSMTAALVPTTGRLNADFGAAGHLNPAFKLYGLVFDTDVDLVYAARGSRGPRIGVDFSRNLGSELEIHGEWARSTDVSRGVLTASNGWAVQQRSTSSALVGLRYLTRRETTIIFELYRNGDGYSRDELTQFFDLVRASATQPALAQSARAAASSYNRPNAARHYAYLRVSQKEPFDILDFSPSVTLIANTADRSHSLIPELLYAGFKNLELRLRLALNSGNTATDYGEKPVRSRVELRARYFF